ncbi:hypothetical protein PIB30_108553 [Stylosanthes scabra]|uniref:Uncharacterized protein n=1 Tax=Stylosanthes scabra TaxID=79078 RepID=A0ABU6R138_9FABA|nr:hypothetical protein [Stylosanthes scabra]
MPRGTQGQRNDETVTEVSKTAPHEKNHYCPLPRQLGKRKRPPLNAWTTKKHVAAGTQEGGTRFTCIKSPEVDRTTRKKLGKWVVTRKLGPKALSSRVGAISQKDLNYPQLYKQGASPPQALGHAVELVTEGTSSHPEC